MRDRLEVQVIALMSASEEDSSGGLQPATQLAEARFNNPGSGLYGEILRSDGYPSWRSNSLTGTGLEFRCAAEVRRAPLRRAAPRAMARPCWRLSRGIEWQFDNGVTRSFVYSVAEDLEPYYAQLNRLPRPAVRLVRRVDAVAARRAGHPAAPAARAAATSRARDRSDRSRRDDGAGRGYPRELLGITTNLNTLLRSERERLARYRNTLGNLAHSFKTPLAVMRNLLSAHAGARPAGRAATRRAGRPHGRHRQVSAEARGCVGRHGSRHCAGRCARALEALRGALLKVYVERGLTCELQRRRRLHCSSATAKT